MAFTTKEVEEIEVAPPRPLVAPKPEKERIAEPERNPILEPKPENEPDLVPA